VIKAFELSAEMVAFLFQVFEYRGEISHAGILAGHGWPDAFRLWRSPMKYPLEHNLLQLRVFRLGLFQDGDVGISSLDK
jgi:hypothetical protein